MKIATAVYKNVISPRTDIANEIFIYKFNRGKFVSKKTFIINSSDPFHFYSVIKEHKVHKIILGSCPNNILNLLLAFGAEVYINAMGNPDDVIEGILSGKSDLSPLSIDKKALKIKHLSE